MTATLLQDISLEQVGNQLQKLIGLDQLSMSAEEVLSHLEDTQRAGCFRVQRANYVPTRTFIRFPELFTSTTELHYIVRLVGGDGGN